MEQETITRGANFISEGKIIHLPFAAITHAGIAAGQVVIYTTGVKYPTAYDLTEIQRRLPAAQFMRVHREFIIAPVHVDSIEQYQVRIGRHRIQVNYFYRTRLLAALDLIEPKPFIDISRDN